MVALSRVLIIATGRGGPVGESVSVRSEAEVRRVLVGGDLAQMALAALKGGAIEVVCVRVNRATPAVCDLGDLYLTAKNPGQIGDGILVRRYTEPSGKGAIELRNPVTGEHERYGGLPDTTQAMWAVRSGGVAHAEPRDKPRILTDWLFFDGGAEGGADWQGALESHQALEVESTVLGSADPRVLELAEAYIHYHQRPLYAGAGAYATKGPLLAATYRLADAAEHARLVCNTVIDRDMQTQRDITMPAYYLAAYAAGLYASGHRDGPQDVDFPALGFIFNEEDVQALTDRRIIPAPYDHLSERYRLLSL